MRTGICYLPIERFQNAVGMKPLSERDENLKHSRKLYIPSGFVGMKPLSERDENKVQPEPRQASANL